MIATDSLHAYAFCMLSVLPEPITVSAPVVTGAGRGRTIGVPTINLSLKTVPVSLRAGVYGARVLLDGQTVMGAVHFGERPVFHDTTTLEVHIIDQVIEKAPAALQMDIVVRIRGIEKFASVDDLLKAIHTDIDQIRDYFQSHPL